MEKKHINLGFVILHYMTTETTFNTVDSICKNIDTENYKIVIVDNASPNDSYEKLEKKYIENEDIVLIKNDKNWGFAKGNNIGFKYLKENYIVDFIILMNNDILLIDQHINQKLNKYFNIYDFDVAGPLIMTGDGRCDVNPVDYKLPSRRFVEKMVKRCKEERLLYKLNLHFLWSILVMFHRMLKKKVSHKDYLSISENVKLHGCFLIFSQKYIKDFSGLNENTFMYVEEDILYAEMVGQNRNMVYLPDIKIYHMEDAATNAIRSSKKDKEMFVLKEHIASYNVLLDVYRKYDIF